VGLSLLSSAKFSKGVGGTLEKCDVVCVNLRVIRRGTPDRQFGGWGSRPATAQKSHSPPPET
jgi:hypothetical protein